MLCYVKIYQPMLCYRVLAWPPSSCPLSSAWLPGLGHGGSGGQRNKRLQSPKKLGVSTGRGGVPFWGVFVIRAHTGVCVGAPDVWKLPHWEKSE